MNTQTNWLTFEQAAQKLGIMRKSLHNWIRNHPEIQQEYVTKMGSRELTGRRCYLIRDDALPIIATMKDQFRGNGKKPSNQDFSEGKKKIAEKAIQNIKTENLILQTARILEQLTARIENLEKSGSKKEVQKLPEPQKTFDALRPLLNIRINEYAKKHGAEHRNLWNILYSQFYKSTGIDLKAIAAARGVDPLDVAQQDGHLQKLYYLSAQIYRVYELK